MVQNGLLIINCVLNVFYALFASPFFLGVLLLLVCFGILSLIRFIIKRKGVRE